MNALTEYFQGPEGRRIAYRHIPGTGPALVFLPGYMSDMAGGKATALQAWASAEGVGVQRTVWSDGLRTIEEGYAAAARAGDVAPLRPAVAAGLVVSALQVWLSDWLRSGQDRPAADVVTELVDHLERSLRP